MGFPVSQRPWDETVQHRDAVPGADASLLKQRVYDPVLRILHGWNALCVIVLLASGELPDFVAHLIGEDLVAVLHVWVGFALTMGFAGRVTWGFVGPTHARWSDMWHPAAWTQSLFSGRLLTHPVRFGHHPKASAAYLLLYTVLMVMVVTGLVRAALEQDLGPLVPWLVYRAEYAALVKYPHEILSTVVCVYVIIHLSAIVAHEFWHRMPMAQSMWSGVQYLRRNQ